jgi:hypothetical protein
MPPTSSTWVSDTAILGLSAELFSLEHKDTAVALRDRLFYAGCWHLKSLYRTTEKDVNDLPGDL